MFVCLFKHPFIEEHLGIFQFEAIVKKQTNKQKKKQKTSVGINAHRDFVNISIILCVCVCVCVFVCVYLVFSLNVCVLVTQSRQTLCDPKIPVHGIL